MANHPHKLACKNPAVLAVLLAGCMTAVAAPSCTAQGLGIKPGMTYAMARSSLLAEGWAPDRDRGAAGQAYKPFPEIICGNGRDAICTGRFIRSGSALLLTIDQNKKTLPITFIDPD